MQLQSDVAIRIAYRDDKSQVCGRRFLQVGMQPLLAVMDWHVTEGGGLADRVVNQRDNSATQMP